MFVPMTIGKILQEQLEDHQLLILDEEESCLHDDT
jgi:hypothetical protein